MGACSAKKTIKQTDSSTQQAQMATPQLQGSIASQQNLQSPPSQQKQSRSVKFVKFQETRKSKLDSPSKRKLQLFKSSFSHQYSIITNPELQSAKTLVQHNQTGQLRQMEVLKRDSHSKEYISWVLKFEQCNAHLLHVIEIYETQKQYEIIEEYIGEGELSKFVANGAVQENIAALIVEQVAKILIYLHNNQFLHNRLTLDSFSLGDSSFNFFVKLTDVRSAYFKEHGKLKDSHVQYASPEKLAAFSSEAYTAESDCWSVGVIAYQLLTGHLPFHIEWKKIHDLKREAKDKEKLQALVREQFSKLDLENVHASKDAVALIRGLLRKDPAERLELEALLESTWIRDAKLTYSCQISKRHQYSERKIQINTTIQDLDYLYQTLMMYMIETFDKAFKFQIDQIIETLGINIDQRIRKDKIKLVYQKFYDRYDVNTHLAQNFKTANIESVTYEHLLIATVSKDKLLAEQHIEQAFQELRQKKNHLTSKSILKFVNGDFQMLKAEVKKFGKKINQSEFRKILLQLI